MKTMDADGRRKHPEIGYGRVPSRRGSLCDPCLIDGLVRDPEGSVDSQSLPLRLLSALRQERVPGHPKTCSNAQVLFQHLTLRRRPLAVHRLFLKCHASTCSRIPPWSGKSVGTFE